MNDKVTTSEKAVEVPQKVTAGPLRASEIRARETGVMWNTWEAVAEQGVSIEDILQPGYWRNVAQKFKTNDTIEIMEVDNAWSAELKVRRAGHDFAEVVHKIKPIVGYPTYVGSSPASDYEVRNNPRDGIHIWRKSTRMTIKNHLPSVSDAQRQVSQLERTLRN